jgi:hypothetical protein
MVKHTYCIFHLGHEGVGSTHTTWYPTRGKSSTASNLLMRPLEYRTVRVVPVGIKALLTSTSWEDYICELLAYYSFP